MTAKQALEVGAQPHRLPELPDREFPPADLGVSGNDDAPATPKSRRGRGGRAAARYALAAGAVAAVLALKLALVPWVEHDTPFLLFFAAVLVAGWYGGFGPGLLSTALAAAGSAYFFMAPYQDLRVADPVQRVRLALFVAEGLFISALTSFLRAARRRADAATAESLRLERRLLEASEQARRDVGHDLHEGLGQQLAGAAMRANRLARRLDAHRADEAGDARAVSELLDRSVAWTRDLAAGLSPVGVRHDGLPAALEELAARTQTAFNVRCTFHSDPGADGVGAEDALHLYLIAREAAANAARLGRPSLIRLALSATPDTLILTVEDDGVHAPAFDAPVGGGNDGYDTNGGGDDFEMLCHRARVIGARLQAQPLAPHGTAVTCFYPRRHPVIEIKP